MSKESYWYDEANKQRARTKEKNIESATKATEIAFRLLSDSNADERAAFWKRIHLAITKEASSAPDADCKIAAEELAKICFKIGHAADGHP